MPLEGSTEHKTKNCCQTVFGRYTLSTFPGLSALLSLLTCIPESIKLLGISVGS